AVHRHADRRHAAEDVRRRRVARRSVVHARRDPREATARCGAARAARERGRRSPGVPARAARARAVRVRVRIAAEHRGAYTAIDDAARTATVELTGKAFHTADDKRALPTVGDWVVVDNWDAA